MAKVPAGKMLVAAVEGHQLPMIDKDGKTYLGRFVGLNQDGSMKPDGELVDVHMYYYKHGDDKRKAIRILALEGEEMPAKAKE
jgi:hypothetical protein